MFDLMSGLPLFLGVLRQGRSIAYALRARLTRRPLLTGGGNA
jgi:hypothetical protein